MNLAGSEGALALLLARRRFRDFQELLARISDGTFKTVNCLIQLMPDSALPDNEDAPTLFRQITNVSLVPCDVLLEFVLPEFLASSGARRVGTTGMPVPIAAVNEDNSIPLGQHDIRLAREAPCM